MKKVSFDFDRTLSTKKVQDYAKSLIDEGVEVHITTARFENANQDLYNSYNNDDLFKVAKSLGIPKNRIHFMNMIDKYEFLISDEDFIFHLDDDFTEIRLIRENCYYTKGIWLENGPNWIDECNELLKN